MEVIRKGGKDPRALDNRAGGKQIVTARQRGGLTENAEPSYCGKGGKSAVDDRP